MTRHTSLLLFFVLAAGCQSDARDAAPVARDVTIVENNGPQWTAATSWRIEARPLLSIGAVDGPAEYQLFRVARALRLNSGGIVIANAGTTEIRFYDKNGKFTHSTGGRGSGPGEYESIPFFRRFGPDSLVAWDGRLDRGTVISLDGKYGRTIGKPPMGAAFVYYIDTFGDGALLGVGPGYKSGKLPEVEEVEEVVRLVALQARPASGVIADTALLFRYRPDARIDTIGGFFFHDAYATSELTTSLPFGRQAVIATDGDLLHYGTGESFEIRTFNAQGKLVRVVRAARPNAPLTRALIDQFIASELSEIKNAQRRESMQRFYNAVVFPKTVPAFSDFIVDAEHNLWVSDFHQRRAAPTAWTVFDKDGRLLGSLQSPSGAEIYEIGADYLIGRSLDHLNVERVVLYRLVKPGG